MPPELLLDELLLLELLLLELLEELLVLLDELLLELLPPPLEGCELATDVPEDPPLPLPLPVRATCVPVSEPSFLRVSQTSRRISPLFGFRTISRWPSPFSATIRIRPSHVRSTEIAWNP